MQKRVLFPLLISSLFLFFGACAKEEPSSASNEAHSHHVSASECKQCHQDIYKEWKGSMHASSTALSDPLHGAVYKQVMGDPHQSGLTKNGNFPVCLKCHVPFAAMDKETNIGAHPIYNEGISCTVCHSAVAYKGNRKPDGKMRYGVDTYEYKLEEPHGNHKDLAALHPSMDMEKNRTLRKTNDVCMGCHDQRQNGKGTPVCNTGEEYAASGTKTDCVQCHMPVVDGRVKHSLVAGHDFSGKTQARGVRLAVDGKQNGESLNVTVLLENRLPHNFPTAAPFRNLMLKISALDAAGSLVWTNYQTHPAQEDPSAFMKITFQGKDGKPSPPPTATGILSDTRLKPYEKRTMEYKIPAASVATVKAELFYNLVLPAQAKNEEIKLPETWKQPVRVGEGSWKVSTKQ